MMRVAAYASAVVGRKLRLMVHRVCPARLAPQVAAVCEKLPELTPPMVVEVMPITALVSFAMVTISD
jgi:hypothetical protein